MKNHPSSAHPFVSPMNNGLGLQMSKRFLQEFSHSPTLSVTAPGRINIIGEHTDYNNGFVLPAAVDKKIHFAFAKNNSNTVRLIAVDINQQYSYKLSENTLLPKTGWQKYVVGMTRAFLKTNQGFDCVFGGDLPHGAGMSSSSALCCGLAYGLNELFELDYDKASMTPAIQKAEAISSGVNGGIMDQFSIMMGQKDKAILLDCQDLSYQYLPLHLKDHCFLLCNTNIAHELAATEYNTRRAECEAGMKYLQAKGVESESLRTVTSADLDQYKEDMDTTLFKRCNYVIQENQRVHQATVALANGDLQRLGLLLYQSHEGLQYDYEVSCGELDFLVAFAKTQSYVAGARMMGGGFGGCTLNLLPKDKVDLFLEMASDRYRKEFAIEMDGYEVMTGNGVETFPK